MSKYIPKPTSDTGKMRTLSEELVLKSKGSLLAPREVMNSIQRLAPEAVETLEHLMLNSKADSVRLKAAIEVLGLAGISKENRITITTSVEELDDTGLNSRLAELLGKAGQTVIEAEAKDITPKEIH